MSGLELCWETRLIATQPAADLRDHDVVHHRATTRLIEALDSGADDFLGKPPVPEELYARLRAAERFAAMQRELIRLATTDSLTGMFNRRAFFEKAKELCVRARGRCAAVRDHDRHRPFQAASTTRYGHDVGDEAICAVAQELMSRAARSPAGSAARSSRCCSRAARMARGGRRSPSGCAARSRRSAIEAGGETSGADLQLRGQRMAARRHASTGCSSAPTWRSTRPSSAAATAWWRPIMTMLAPNYSDAGRPIRAGRASAPSALHEADARAPGVGGFDAVRRGGHGGVRGLEPRGDRIERARRRRPPWRTRQARRDPDRAGPRRRCARHWRRRDGDSRPTT